MLQRTAGNAAVTRLLTSKTPAHHHGGPLSIQRTSKSQIMLTIALNSLGKKAAYKQRKENEFKRWVEMNGVKFDAEDDVDGLVQHFSTEDVLQVIRMVKLRIADLGNVKAYEARNMTKVNVDPLMDPKLAKSIHDTKQVQTKKSYGRRAAQSVYDMYKNLKNNKDMRKDLTEGQGRTGTPLGDLLEAQALMCREKALFAQVVLADLGIPTTVRSGQKPQGSRHAWLVVAGRWEVDPIQGSIEKNLDRTNKYTEEVQEKVVVSPSKPVAGTELERRMDNCVAQFAKLHNP
ncbi:hypothetical protein [Fodinicola acaciae]|uniref:hypothetical protein n=1 Tax=Fodinicola acaciae TaxID=2681555 RepID=UPI0013D1B929|nr:hypothetical protein [Fodinicola acaciae]